MSDTPETDACLSAARGESLEDLCRKLERERDEARHEIEGWRNKWECAVEMAARAEVERDEARELAQQMSESNQVLMADVCFYRNAWEQRRESPQ
jgi:hypothetical protein